MGNFAFGGKGTLLRNFTVQEATTQHTWIGESSIPICYTLQTLRMTDIYPVSNVIIILYYSYVSVLSLRYF